MSEGEVQPDWWAAGGEVGVYECTECGKTLARISRADHLPAYCEETGKNTLIHRLTPVQPQVWEGDNG